MQGVAEDAINTALLYGPTNSAFVLTCVGSLEEVTIRQAGHHRNKKDGIHTYREKMEVVSLTGTFTLDSKKLHIVVSFADGTTVGGQLIAGRIYTTVELVLGTIEGVAFDRVKDKRTGFKELDVHAIHEC